MSHGSDDSDNYWPGYVDALTSMVQVLAFVMMMLAMAVFVLSQSVSKKAVEAIAQAVNATVKPNSDLKQLTQAVLDKIQSGSSATPSNSSSKPSAPSASQSTASESSSDAAGDARPDRARVIAKRSEKQTPAIPSNAPRNVIDFEAGRFNLDADKAQSLAKFMQENRVADQKKTVMINAYAYSGDGALSEARRLAYYRAMLLRKQLIDQQIPPDGIKINVKDTTDKSQGSSVETIVMTDSASQPGAR